MTIVEAFVQFELEELYNKHKADKTIRNYRTTLSSFLMCNTDIPIQLLEYEHIIRWQMNMRHKGDAVSYVASNLIRFRKVLRYLRKRGVQCLDSELIEPPKVPRNKVVFLLPDEIQRMIDVTDRPRDKALIILTFASGGRINEVLSLNRDSIRDGEATITGKGDKEGVLEFDEAALAVLQAYLDTRTDRLRPLFVSSQRRRLGYARANQIFHEAADLAGIDKNVSTHIMRHSFATDLLLNGANIVEVKEHLRHENISTTMRYLHVTDEHKKQSYRKYHTRLKST